MKKKCFDFVICILSSLCFLPTSIAAESEGSLQIISVYGESLQGNLSGDAPNRDVFVYLPPSYSEEIERRYPVIYFLHGYAATAQRYVDFLSLTDLADEAISDGAAEMIIVIPNAYTKYGGSFYSSSPTIGDWEGFIAKDLINAIDDNYRTVATRESRGLSGHSMGGYGALRIGMKYPQVFSSMFIMSAGALMDDISSAEEVEEQKSEMTVILEEGQNRSYSRQALYAAWAANPDNPPYYFDWPYESGELQPFFQARWLANSPLAMVGQYVPALRQFDQIYIDVGDEDSLAESNVRLSEELERLNVEHDFEIYAGNHGNRVVQRFGEELMPFFSENLIKQE